MKVQKIFLSGCSALTRQTLAFSGAERKFAFAGDSHVYVFDCNDGAYTVESVVPFCKDVEDVAELSTPEHDVWGGIGINSIAFCPIGQHLLAACALRVGRLEFWDTNKRAFIRAIEVDSEVAIKEVRWSPFKETEMFVITEMKKMKVLDLTSEKHPVKDISSRLPPLITTAEWHPRKTGKILVASIQQSLLGDFGESIPEILMLDLPTKKRDIAYVLNCRDHGVDPSAEVVSLVWNPGEDVFLALLSDSNIFLFTEAEPQPKMVFEKQTIGVTNICWIDNISGDFLTVSKKVGALRVWNASSPIPKRIVKISNVGILGAIPCHQDHFLFQLVSGAVLLYDLKAEKIRFQTDVCHTAQIQDCQVHPCNPDLMGTVSFDGSMRVWDLKAMKLDQIFTDRQAKGPKDSILQCLAWYHHKTREEMDAEQAMPNSEDDPDVAARGKIVVYGTSLGVVKLVDLRKNKVVWKKEYSGTCIYGLDWNSNGILAVGPTMQEVHVLRFHRSKMNFSELYKVATEHYVRVLTWSPLQDATLAVGLFDGKIVVHSQGETTPITHKLSNERILCVDWNPQIDGLLAVGSFDSVVYLVTLEVGRKCVTEALRHHTDRVRSLAWNYELPWMLISAADDQQVAIWDIRTKEVLVNVIEPSLALTSFSSHPNRPFRLFSSHFDSSVMCWNLLGIPEVSLTQLQFLLGRPISETLGTTEEAMAGSFNFQKLSGKVSKLKSELIGMRKSADDVLANFEQILRFFQVQDGQEEFWAMISILSGEGPKENTDKLRINHISDITFVYQTKARDLQQVSGMKMLGTALSKKEDRLMEAANLMLKSGNFQEYCEIQKELGNFEDAIAAAPKVSLSYWQQCVTDYTAHLNESLNAGSMSGNAIQSGVNQLEEFVDYSLLAGNFEGASNILELSGYSQNAKLIRVNQISQLLEAESVLSKHAAAPVQAQRPPKSVHQLGPDDQDLLVFTNLQAQRKFLQREPLISAAIHLSLSDTRRAIQKLILSNNFEYAYVLAKQFEQECLDQVIVGLFQKALHFKSMGILNTLLEQVRNVQVREVLDIALLRSQENFASGDIRSQSARAHPDSVVDFILANRLPEACKITLQHVKGGTSLSPQTFFELYLLGFFDLYELPGAEFEQLLSLYRDAALIKALYFRLFQQLRWLLHCTQSVMKDSAIARQVKSLVANENDEVLNELVMDTHNTFVQENFNALHQFLSAYQPSFLWTRGSPPGSFRHRTTWLSQANLTRNRSKKMAVSSLSDRTLSSLEHAVELNAAGGYYLSFEEALDFQLLMPFNPFAQGTREPFNPYVAVSRAKAVDPGKSTKAAKASTLTFQAFV